MLWMCATKQKGGCQVGKSRLASKLQIQELYYKGFADAGANNGSLCSLTSIMHLYDGAQLYQLTQTAW